MAHELGRNIPILRLPRALGLTPVDEALPAFQDVKHRQRGLEPYRKPESRRNPGGRS